MRMRQDIKEMRHCCASSQFKKKKREIQICYIWVIVCSEEEKHKGKSIIYKELKYSTCFQWGKAQADVWREENTFYLNSNNNKSGKYKAAQLAKWISSERGALVCDMPSCYFLFFFSKGIPSRKLGRQSCVFPQVLFSSKMMTTTTTTMLYLVVAL